MSSKIPRPCSATTDPKNIRPTTLPRTLKSGQITQSSPLPSPRSARTPSAVSRSFLQPQGRSKSVLDSPVKSVSSISKQFHPNLTDAASVPWATATTKESELMLPGGTSTTSTKTISGSDASIGSFANETVVDINEINSALIGLILPSSDHDLMKLQTNPLNATHEKIFNDKRSAPAPKECKKGDETRHSLAPLSPPRRENTFNYEEKPVLELTPLSLSSQIENLCDLESEGQEGLSDQIQTRESQAQDFVDELLQDAALIVSSHCAKNGVIENIIAEESEVCQTRCGEALEQNHQDTAEREKFTLAENNDFTEEIHVANRVLPVEDFSSSDWKEDEEELMQPEPDKVTEPEPVESVPLLELALNELGSSEYETLQEVSFELLQTEPSETELLKTVPKLLVHVPSKPESSEPPQSVYELMVQVPVPSEPEYFEPTLSPLVHASSEPVHSEPECLEPTQSVYELMVPVPSEPEYFEPVLTPLEHASSGPVHSEPEFLEPPHLVYEPMELLTSEHEFLETPSLAHLPFEPESLKPPPFESLSLEPAPLKPDPADPEITAAGICVSEIVDAIQLQLERFPSIVYFEKEEGNFYEVRESPPSHHHSCTEMDEHESSQILDPFTTSLAEESSNAMSFTAPSIRYSTLTVLEEEEEISAASQDDEKSCDLENISETQELECSEIKGRLSQHEGYVHIYEVVGERSSEKDPVESHVPKEEGKEIDLGKSENESTIPCTQDEMELLPPLKFNNLNKMNPITPVTRPTISEENVRKICLEDPLKIAKFSGPKEVTTVGDMMDASNMTEDEFFQSDAETQTHVGITSGKSEVQAKATSFFHYNREESLKMIPDVVLCKEQEELKPCAGASISTRFYSSHADEEEDSSSLTETETKYSTDTDFYECGTPIEYDEEGFAVNLEDHVKDAGPNSMNESSNLQKTKRTTTIFKVDRPLSPTQVSDAGSGQYGDGDAVLPSKLTSFPVFSEASQVKGSRKVAKVLSLHDYEMKPDTTFQHRTWNSIEHDPPLLNFKNSTVEILSKVNLLATSTSKYSFPTSKQLNSSGKEEETGTNEIRKCRAIVPTKSTLILQRSLESSNVFCKQLQIHNSTSCEYAFKVTCNAAAAPFLSIMPQIGMVPPHSEISVNVATARCHKFDFQQWMRGTRSNTVSVKICRFHLKDTDRLSDLFIAMERDHPDLVMTQTIEKIILWDSEDLNGMHQMFNSIEDVKERSFLKDEIHKSGSSIRSSQDESALPVYLQDIIHNIQGQVAGFNENLTEIYEELAYFRNCQNAIITVLVIIVAVFAITQLFGGTENKKLN